MIDSEYEDYLFQQGWFDYRPVHSGFPRNGHIGESVYFDAWRNLMREPARDGEPIPNGMLAHMLRELPGYVTQRHASICTSVVTWLGTSCGQSVRYEAERLVEKGSAFRGKAWIASWAMHNTRANSVNLGVRTVEQLLAPEDHFGREVFSGMVVLQKRPKISSDDLECIDHLMKWFGEEGESFIAECDKVREERRKAEFEFRRKHTNEVIASLS